MDVSVLSKYGQRSLRSAAKASILGDGLLQRTRSTSLALLGFTAAIGLAMVALALNQGWPLIAGAPIPGVGGGHEAVGDASVAARATGQDGHPAIGAGTVAKANSAAFRRGSRLPGRSAALGGSRAPQAAGLVVSHPTPTSPTDGPDGEAIPEAPQAAEQPTATAAPAPAAEAVSASNSNPSPEPVAQSTPESPVPAQTPQPADNGEGQDHGRHLGRGGGHGHGHSGGGDNSGTPEPSESPETTPVPSETPPPETNTPEESDSGQSHTPSSGHGGGHGHW